MILAVYSVLLAVALVVGGPWWLARMATSGRYRAGLPGRLGRIPRGLAAAVSGRRVIWLHAVSVGEVLAATELVKELRKALPDWVIAVSTTTETGQKLARERFEPQSPVFYLPLDFAGLIRRYLRVLHPELLILMESELWPNLIEGCALRGVPVAVVNARISDRSLPRYLRLKKLWRPMLERVSLFLSQSEESRSRLVRIGAPSERVKVSGNLKYDVKATGQNAMTSLLREQISVGAKVVVAGSTLEGEEKILLEAWPRVLDAVPGSLLVIAPRRPERFGMVAALIESAGFDVVRASELKSRERIEGQECIILLDTIGDLASVYSLGDVAFVGGSLVTMGGHNPLEPARFGVPVIMGTSSENFREIVEAMRIADAICIVESSEMAKAMIHLLTSEAKAREMGDRGRSIFAAEAGATVRTATSLLDLLKRKAS